MAPFVIPGVVVLGLALIVKGWVKKHPPPDPVLDASLSPEEADAVTIALARETDADNLDDFASAFDASVHPLTTTALRVRASELRA